MNAKDAKKIGSEECGPRLGGPSLFMHLANLNCGPQAKLVALLLYVNQLAVGVQGAYYADFLAFVGLGKVLAVDVIGGAAG